MQINPRCDSALERIEKATRGSRAVKLDMQVGGTPAYLASLPLHSGLLKAYLRIDR
jgi:hypothetical protein